MMTRKQKEAFQFIVEYFDREGVAPSFDEIKLHMGLRSKAGVHRLVHGLAARGVIRILPNRARAMEVVADMPEVAPTSGALSSIKGIIRDAAHEKISKTLALEMIGGVCDFHQRRDNG